MLKLLTLLNVPQVCAHFINVTNFNRTMNQFEPEPRDDLRPFSVPLPLGDSLFVLVEQKWGAVWFLNKHWPWEGRQLSLLRRHCRNVPQQILRGSFHFKKQVLCQHVATVTRLQETFCLVRLGGPHPESVNLFLAKLDFECEKFLQEIAPAVLALMQDELF